MSEANTLSFDIVVATRNRVDALEMSIPLMISQSRQPNKLIVVDASDDQTPIKTLVENATKDWSGEVIFIHLEQPGLTRQRNVGLTHVSADVVMYPDDDSLWHEGFAEYVMRAYEADTEGVVGGVCGKPVLESPVPIANLQYKKSTSHTVRTATEQLRKKFEHTFFPNPFILYAFEKWPTLPKLPWLEDKNCVIVENMTGFRMSFRTAVLKEFGFDETLCSRVGYAPCEDMDVSMHTLKKGYHLVAALDAKVFHHKHYSQRAAPFKYGFCRVLHHLYVVRKLMDEGSKPWKAASRYTFHRVLAYAVGSINPHTRQMFLGSLAAWRERKRIFACDLADLDVLYAELCDKHIT